MHTVEAFTQKAISDQNGVIIDVCKEKINGARHSGASRIYTSDRRGGGETPDTVHI